MNHRRTQKGENVHCTRKSPLPKYNTLAVQLNSSAKISDEDQVKRVQLSLAFGRKTKDEGRKW